MAKRKPLVPETAPTAEQAGPARFGPTLPPHPPAPPPDPPAYTWPRKARCPRCQSLDTRQTGYNEARTHQHRRCEVPICGHRWKVAGIKV